MAAQSIEQAVIERLRELSPDKQQEVLDFASFLGTKSPAPKLKSVRGLCADLNFRISAEEIAEARREMWAGFPREYNMARGGPQNTMKALQ
jgi:hypothetical protein